MEGSALLLNRIVKVVVERVVKEMQSKEYELPKGFLVQVIWFYSDFILHLNKAGTRYVKDC